MPQPEPDTFGKWLKTNRRAHDLTQAELARNVGCAVITIRKIESDQLRPSRRLALLLLRELGVAEGAHDTLIRSARGHDKQDK